MSDTPLTIDDLDELGPINPPCIAFLNRERNGNELNVDCVLDKGHGVVHETVAGEYFGAGIKTRGPYRPGPPLGWDR